MRKETVGSLADLVGGEVKGDRETPITGVGDLRTAGPEQIGFLADVKLEEAARSTKAGALLVRRPVDTPAAQIVVGNVYAAFAKVAQLFFPAPRVERHDVHPSAFVDPSVHLEPPVQVGPCAVVESGSRIGAGTVLRAGVLVGERCRIGRDCVLHPGVVLYPGVELGDRVVVHGGCVLGSDGFGYAREDDGSYVKFPQMGRLIVEDDVEIGANTTIDRGALKATRIGRGSKLDNLIQVGHNCEFGAHVAVAGLCGFSGSTILGDRVSIAGHVVSSGHLKVGDDVRVGGASVLHRDVAAPGDYIGYPLMEKARWMRTVKALDKLVELQQRVRELEKRLAKAGEEGA